MNNTSKEDFLKFCENVVNKYEEKNMNKEEIDDIDEALSVGCDVIKIRMVRNKETGEIMSNIIVSNLSMRSSEEADIKEKVEDLVIKLADLVAPLHKRYLDNTKDREEISTECTGHNITPEEEFVKNFLRDLRKTMTNRD